MISFKQFLDEAKDPKKIADQVMNPTRRGFIQGVSAVASTAGSKISSSKSASFADIPYSKPQVIKDDYIPLRSDRHFVKVNDTTLVGPYHTKDVANLAAKGLGGKYFSPETLEDTLDYGSNHLTKTSNENKVANHLKRAFDKHRDTGQAMDDVDTFLHIGADMEKVEGILKDHPLKPYATHIKKLDELEYEFEVHSSEDGPVSIHKTLSRSEANKKYNELDKILDDHELGNYGDVFYGRNRTKYPRNLFRGEFQINKTETGKEVVKDIRSNNNHSWYLDYRKSTTGQ